MTSMAKHDLVVATHSSSLARRREVVAAIAAAQSLVKIVVTSEAEAQNVTDQIRTIALGRKALKAAEDETLADVKAITKAVKEVSAAHSEQFDSGERDGRNALEAFMVRRRHEAAEASRKAQAEAERRAAEEAERLKAEAPALDETDVPPPLAVPPPAKPELVRGGQASSGMQRTPPRFELYNHHDVDPTWLMLVGNEVRGAVLEAERRGEIAIPVGHENAIIHRGVRVWRDEVVAIR